MKQRNEVSRVVHRTRRALGEIADRTIARASYGGADTLVVHLVPTGAQHEATVATFSVWRGDGPLVDVTRLQVELGR